jgi:hypothetical protein
MITMLNKPALGSYMSLQLMIKVNHLSFTSTLEVGSHSIEGEGKPKGENNDHYPKCQHLLLINKPTSKLGSKTPNQHNQLKIGSFYNHLIGCMFLLLPS